MNAYNFFPWFTSLFALGCYLASHGCPRLAMACSLMLFFFFLCLYLQFLWFWQHDYTPQYAHATCVSQASFPSSSFYTGFLVFSGKSLDNPQSNPFSQSPADTVQPSWFSQSSATPPPQVKPIEVEPSRCTSHFLSAGWKMREKVLSA